MLKPSFIGSLADAGVAENNSEQDGAKLQLPIDGWVERDRFARTRELPAAGLQGCHNFISTTTAAQM